MADESVLQPAPATEIAPTPDTPIEPAPQAPQSAEPVAPMPAPESVPVSVEPVHPTPPVTQPSTPAPIQSQPQPIPAPPSPKSFLTKALEAIQFRKRAKLEKIMKLAIEKRTITNDQVEKLLHVSDATATRYLSNLVRQGKLKQLGIRGSARYEPTIGSIPTV